MTALFQVGTGHQHIRVEVLRRERPDAEDYWDGNWVTARVELRIHPWSGTYDAMLRTEEFVSFREDLEVMDRNLEGDASFSPMEPWLEFSLQMDPHGRISLEGEAMPEGSGRLFGQVGLKFTLPSLIDQSYLPELIGQLREVEAAFPVKSRPDE